MLYLIMGRTAAGKDRFAQILEANGLKGVKSYTTRPKRNDEDNHIFVSQEEADSIQDRAAYTKIGDYEYFATKDQIENADFYIIDPKGMRELTAKMPKTAFSIIYIIATKEDRKRHFLTRQPSVDVEEQFNKREESENDQFEEFESLVEKIHHNSNNDFKLFHFEDNVYSLHTFQNQYEIGEDDFESEALAVVNSAKANKRLHAIVDDAINLGIIKANEQNEIAVYTKDDPFNPHYVSRDRFVAIMTQDTSGLGTFMREYLGRTSLLE